MINLVLNLNPLPSHIKRFFIAYSGGIDSVVLLHALKSYQDRYEMVLWHINHGLQDNADEMEAFAQQQAQENGITCRIDRLNLSAAVNNLEARAREQRYALFAKALNRHDALLTAHHMNDQAETLLLNLLRGSGAQGLSAIAQQRPLGQGIVFRPLINTRRTDIEAYAQQHQLAWVEDPSNRSLNFDRNYLRHKVLPLLKERWPATVQQLHRAADWQNEIASLQNEYAQEDYLKCAVNKQNSEYTCLNLEAMSKFSAGRKKNLLRYWMIHQGKKVIGYKKIQELLTQLEARADAMPVIHGEGFTLRRYQGCLYIVNPLPSELPSTVLLKDSEDPVNVTMIALTLTRKELLKYCGVEEQAQKIELRFRQSTAEKRTQGSAHKLKRLFQKYQVPPWLREVTPQIWIDDQLIELWCHSEGS